MPVTQSLVLPEFDDYSIKDEIQPDGKTKVTQTYTLKGEIIAVVEIYYISGVLKRIPKEFILTDYTKSETP